MDPEDRLDPVIRRRFGASDRRQDRIDTPLMLGGGVQIAIEEFGARRVAALPLVPETSHPFGCSGRTGSGERFRRRNAFRTGLEGVECEA